MNEQVIQLLENYKNGVPVKIERSSIVLLSVAALIVVALSAIIVKTIKNL